MIQAGERDGAERFGRRGFGVDRDLGSGYRRASLTGAQRITALWLRSRTVGDLDRAGEALGDPRQRCSVTLIWPRPTAISTSVPSSPTGKTVRSTTVSNIGFSFRRNLFVTKCSRAVPLA